jgi:hypothetical protein
MNPTKTGLYSTNVGDRFILLYWDGEDWVDQDGIRPCYKKVQWTGKPLFVPALRTWVGLTDEEIEQGNKESWVTEQAWQSAVWWAEARLKEKNNV